MEAPAGMPRDLNKIGTSGGQHLPAADAEIPAVTPREEATLLLLQMLFLLF